MLTILDVFALAELREQSRALNNCFRSLINEAELRMLAFDPGEPESEEDADLVQSHGESLVDDHETAVRIAQQAMGVLAVLIHAHVENGLKRIYKATRGRALKDIQWLKLIAAYDEAGIDLGAHRHFALVDAVRATANCYKHDGGIPKADFLLPNGLEAAIGVPLDFSEFDYIELSRAAEEFLESVGHDADRPHIPTLQPRVTVQATTEGHTFLRTPLPKPLGEDPEWTVEVVSIVTDGSEKDRRTIATFDGNEMHLKRSAFRTGTVVKYWFRFLNSRNERGPLTETTDVVCL